MCEHVIEGRGERGVAEGENGGEGEEGREGGREGRMEEGGSNPEMGEKEGRWREFEGGTTNAMHVLMYQ